MVAARRGAPHTVLIEVRDNGIGIAPIHHSRIFEQFYQVPNIEPSRHHGFGLSLAIAARIAALMGTRIQLRSALHLGSTFSFVLAGSAARSPDNRQAAAPEINRIGDTQLSCLLIDDDPHTFEKHHALLAHWGFRVVVASSLGDAVAALHARGAQFNVVLNALAFDTNSVDGVQSLNVAKHCFPGALLIHIGRQPSAAQVVNWREQGIQMLPWPVAPAKLRALLSTRWPMR